jgi:hypothetical protein
MKLGINLLGDIMKHVVKLQLKKARDDMKIKSFFLLLHWVFLSRAHHNYIDFIGME